jgi:hypothetical protein
MTVKQTSENGIGKGKPGPGRPKGVPNKVTLAAKEAIHEAFEQMGGIEALVTWANKGDNAKVFYSQIWPKIVPLTVGGDPDSPHRIEIVSRIVDTRD